MMDVHLFNAAELGVEFVDSHRLADLYGDQYRDIESALVIENPETLTTFICQGSRDEVRDLAHDIIRMMRVQSRHHWRRSEL